MNLFAAVGEYLGRGAVESMVESGELDFVIKTAMADQMRKLATEPKYQHASKRLIEIAEKIEAEIANGKFQKPLPWWKRLMTTQPTR